MMVCCMAYNIYKAKAAVALVKVKPKYNIENIQSFTRIATLKSYNMSKVHHNYTSKLKLLSRTDTLIK